MISFNTENMVQQKFPFRKPIMDYIFKNVSATRLLKLYQTCKFFYDKYRYNIIEDFEICDSKDAERIVGNSLAIWQHNPAWLRLNNLWISKSFSYYNEEDVPYELDFQKFSRLTYTKLYMYGDFLFEEYEFLVKPTTLRHLIVDGSIFCQDGSDLSNEECIERAPHVSTFDLYLNMALPMDMNRLVSMEREIKLTSLHLFDLRAIPDPALVIEFFKKHATPNIDYHFEFYGNDVNDIQRFFNTVDDGLRAWKLLLEIPPALSSSFIDLTGKTVVITGAAEGIGKAATILFRQLGASVIAVTRYCQKSNALNDECQNIINAGFLHTFSCNIRFDKYDIGKFFKRIGYKFGTKFDVLVNIADTSSFRTIPFLDSRHSYDRDEYNVLQRNFNIIQRATPYLIGAKGTVINVSHPDVFVTRQANASTITNIKEQIKNAETQLSTSGVRINSVNSGSPVSALRRSAGMSDVDFEKYLQQSKKSHEQQIANAIAFLASDAATLIDGSTLNVNTLKLN